MAVTDVQEAHDALLAGMPAGATHEPCHLCSAFNAETAKEAATVPESTRTFTEDEHIAVLTAAVQRETAALTAERVELKDKLDAASQRADVLEAEKAAAVSERDKAVADLEAFKADIEEKAAIAERKDARVARVKAANEQLPEGFYTDERTQRWAEMADEAFESYVADITAAKSPAGAGTSSTTTKTETAAFTGGETPSGETKGSSLRGLLGMRIGSPIT